jgi:hypothetical protein
VAGAGDVNGDGFADVIIGAPGYSVSDIKYGRAYLYLGGGGNGRQINPKLLNYDLTRRISRLGRSDTNMFALFFRLWSPFGWGEIKPEIELQPFGTPLDGTDTTLFGIWLNPTTMTNKYLSTPENILYHWRVRIHYNPASLPYQSHGRWFSIPWSGWQEAYFRTGPSSTPSLEDIINYLLGKSHYQHDINADGKNDAADVVEYLIP